MYIERQKMGQIGEKTFVIGVYNFYLDKNSELDYRHTTCFSSPCIQFCYSGIYIFKHEFNLMLIQERRRKLGSQVGIWTMIFCCCLEMQQPLYCPCIAISEAHKDKGHSTVHPFLFSFRKKYFYLSFIIIILFFQKIKLCVVISVYNLQHSSYSSFFFFFKTYSTYLSSSMSS